MPPFAVDLPTLFERHHRAALLFSGGKESLVLLDALRPWADRVTLLWVGVGSHARQGAFMFHHMIEWIRKRGQGWTLIELSSDLPAHWQKFGFPSRVVPLANMPGGLTTPIEPRIHSWHVCCATLRQNPVWEYVKQHPELTLVLHGQRRDDGNMRAPLGRLDAVLPGVEAHAPLWRWSTDDPSSRECWCQPLLGPIQRRNR